MSPIHWILIGVGLGLLWIWRPWRYVLVPTGTGGTAGGTTPPASPPATPAGTPPATPPATTTTVTRTRWVRFTEFPWRKVIRWTVTIVILGLLILLYAFPKTFFHWVAAADYKIRGTDPKEWTEERFAVVLPPNFSQNKALGGPLLWNNSAKVKIQSRFGNENVKDGLCFVGVIPPAMSTTFKFASYATSYGGYEASLIDVGVSGGKLPSEALQSFEITQHGNAAVARKLKDLSSVKRMEVIKVNNRTGRTAQAGLALNELYIQLRGTEIPERISVNRQESVRVFQYVVEVGVEETLFMLPPTPWKYLWIAPVQHKDYQASYDGKFFPSTGGLEDGLLGIECTINGEKKTLENAQLLQDHDLTSGEIRLQLKVPPGTPTDAKKATGVKPAKIIVGIQI